MAKVAIAALKLPDGRLVFQRRDNKAPRGANKLSFFGGHLKAKESHRRAIKRELGEETSLDVNSLSLRYIQNFSLASPQNSREKITYYLYEISIDSDLFEVYEGINSESYSISEALSLNDLVPSAKYSLQILGRREKNNVV